MVDRLIELSVRHKWTVFAVLLALGLWAERARASRRRAARKRSHPCHRRSVRAGRAADLLFAAAHHDDAFVRHRREGGSGSPPTSMPR